MGRCLGAWCDWEVQDAYGGDCLGWRWKAAPFSAKPWNKHFHPNPKAVGEECISPQKHLTVKSVCRSKARERQEA